MTDDLEQARRTAEQWHLGQTSAGYESGAATVWFSTCKVLQRAPVSN
jgi:hypothetical protein